MKTTTHYLIETIDALQPEVNETKIIKIINKLHDYQGDYRDLATTILVSITGIYVNHREGVVDEFRVKNYMDLLFIWLGFLEGRGEEELVLELKGKMDRAFGQFLVV